MVRTIWKPLMSYPAKICLRMYIYIYTYIHTPGFVWSHRPLDYVGNNGIMCDMYVYIYIYTWMQWAMPSLSGCDMAPLNNTCGRNLFVCLSIGPNSQGFTRTYNFEFPLNHLNLIGFRNSFAHTHKQSAKMWPIIFNSESRYWTDT